MKNSLGIAQTRSDRLTGKVVLITGATSGIGEVTARVLAEKGATVVVVGRSFERADATVITIQQATGNKNVNYLLADLSSMDQVRRLANDFLEQYQRLDILVNNAGAIFSKHSLSVDGIEMTFALNHLSYYLLTNLLLERIKETAKVSGEARIINVASDMHRGAKLDFNDLFFSRRKDYFGYRSYGQSKLANVLFTFELANRLEGTQVSCNALHPGFVATNFGKNNSRLFRSSYHFLDRFALTPEQGAQTIIYLASWPDIKGITGQYFIKCQPVAAGKAAYDPIAAQKLWDVSQLLCNLE